MISQCWMVSWQTTGDSSTNQTQHTVTLLIRLMPLLKVASSTGVMPFLTTCHACKLFYCTILLFLFEWWIKFSLSHYHYAKPPLCYCYYPPITYYLLLLKGIKGVQWPYWKQLRPLKLSHSLIFCDAVVQWVRHWTSNLRGCLLVQSPAIPQSYRNPRQVVHAHISLPSTEQYKLVPAKMQSHSEAGKVTTGLAKSNSRLLLGLWLTSPACYLLAPTVLWDTFTLLLVLYYVY